MDISEFFLFSILLILPFTSEAKSQQSNYEKYGHLPMVQLAKVSPDGENIVSVYNSAEGPSVVVTKFGDTDMDSIIKLKKDIDRVDNIYWLNNERLIVKVSYA